MLPQEQIRYTLEEYLELDRAREEKLEFSDGHVFTPAGASVSHHRIQRNALAALSNKLRGRNCGVFPSDMRVGVPADPPYRDHDLSALCGEARFETLGRQEVFINPALLVEILSDSTAECDRGDKFNYYKSIPSFVEYVLVARDRPHVTQFIKQADNSWLQHEFNAIDEAFRLASLDCRLDLSELYEGVQFPEIENRFNLVAENE